MADLLPSSSKRPRISGDDKLKRLAHAMRRVEEITTEWYQIGLELLGDTKALDIIASNHPKDANRCCIEMFKTWVRCKPDANWDQLATALNEIGLNAAAENIKKQINGSLSDTDDEDPDVKYVEKQLNARTIINLKAEFTRVSENICNIFKGKDLNVPSLIRKLASLDDEKITIFSTDEALISIHSIDELFFHIGKNCNIYDYELLIALVESVECEDAVQILDKFTEKIHSSVFSDLDLLCDDGELRNPKDFLPETHKLKIKYVGGDCTLKTEKLVKRIIYQYFRLKKGSIIFKGVEDGCVAFIYQISPAVKAYLQQYPITAEEVFSDKNKIMCLIIDDEEVKFPAQLEAEFTIVLTGPTGDGKSAACNFFMQKSVFKSRPSFQSVSKKLESEVAIIGGKQIKLIDTPGFLDPSLIKEENDRLEFAESLILMKHGFHAIGLVVNVAKRITAEEDKMYENLLGIYKHYLPYVFVLFTHGKCLGDTEDKQRNAVEEMIKKLKENKTLKFFQVLEKINYRYIVLESMVPMEEGYNAKKSKELVEMINTIVKQNRKPAINDVAQSVAAGLEILNVDEKILVKELADRIKISIEAMIIARSNDFFKFLLQSIISGDGLLSKLINIGLTVSKYVSTAYSFASSAVSSAKERCTFQ